MGAWKLAGRLHGLLLWHSAMDGFLPLAGLRHSQAGEQDHALHASFLPAPNGPYSDKCPSNTILQQGLIASGM